MSITIKFTTGSGEYSRDLAVIAFGEVELAVQCLGVTKLHFPAVAKGEFDLLYDLAKSFMRTGTVVAMRQTAAAASLRYRFIGDVRQIAKTFVATRFLPEMMRRIPTAMLSAIIELDRDDLLAKYACFGERAFILNEIAKNDAAIRCYCFAINFASLAELREIAAITSDKSPVGIALRSRLANSEYISAGRIEWGSALCG